jgi:hypothetical protein
MSKETDPREISHDEALPSVGAHGEAENEHDGVDQETMKTYLGQTKAAWYIYWSERSPRV